MTTRSAGAVIASLLMLLLMSCWLRRPRPPRLLPEDTNAPIEIQEACSLTEMKCSRCHTIDRVFIAQVSTPAQWEAYVGRMRRMTGSGISEADGAVIVRCLVYRSFGTTAGGTL